MRSTVALRPATTVACGHCPWVFGLLPCSGHELDGLSGSAAIDLSPGAIRRPTACVDVWQGDGRTAGTSGPPPQCIPIGSRRRHRLRLSGDGDGMLSLRNGAAELLLLCAGTVLTQTAGADWLRGDALYFARWDVLVYPVGSISIVRHRRTGAPATGNRLVALKPPQLATDGREESVPFRPPRSCARHVTLGQGCGIESFAPAPGDPHRSKFEPFWASEARQPNRKIGGGGGS